MNKVAHYLQEHLSGEVMTSVDARKYFSTDASIFEVVPAIIAYPRNENDVRKAARFSWQLAERGRVIPITARGAGTDLTGGSLGEGIMLVFPAHMHKILELDSKSGDVIIEPGVNFGKLQQTLHTHGRFLPPYPASLQYSTVGGAVGNNAGGEKTIKYGSTRNFVDGLRVVLANGEVIDTKRQTKRELKKKLGLSTFEGEIYRSLDALIEENSDVIDGLALDVTKNSTGYAINDVKRKDGSFDLTPLFVGSQGTLGLVTEIKIATEPYNPKSTVIAAYCDSLSQAGALVEQLRGLKDVPSAIEIVDEMLLNFLHEKNPNLLKDILQPPFPKLVLIVEFDDSSERKQKKMSKKAEKIFQNANVEFRIETEEEKREELWRIRQSAGSMMAHHDGSARALPIIEDGVVPIDQFSNYIEILYKLFKKYELKAAIWGHAGNANLHVQPFLDLSQLGDRQKIFRLMDEYYHLVIEMGGSISGQHNDGRLRGPYLSQLYGAEAYELFGKIKNIFDPHGTLNPGVKVGVTLDDTKSLLRRDYSLDHLFDHMPRS
jgi:FAD/FMN-containing dehydrogenase